MENEIDKLTELLKSQDYSVEKKFFTEEKDSILLSATKNDSAFYVLFLQQDSQYLANDLSADFLPSEIYPDSVPEGFTAAQRNAEIVKNIDLLASKKLEFHAAPSLFNKNRVYIVLAIDGTEQKIYIKKIPRNR